MISSSFTCRGSSLDSLKAYPYNVMAVKLPTKRLKCESLIKRVKRGPNFFTDKDFPDKICIPYTDSIIFTPAVAG